MLILKCDCGVKAVLFDNIYNSMCSSFLVILGYCPHILHSSLLRFRHVFISNVRCR
jgi:hypothetical protein